MLKANDLIDEDIQKLLFVSPFSVMDLRENCALWTGLYHQVSKVLLNDSLLCVYTM